MPRLITLLAGIALMAGSIGYNQKQGSAPTPPKSTDISIVNQNTLPNTSTLSSGTGVFPQIAPGNYNFSFKTADGLTRTYIVHIPKNYNPTKRYPVLFGFHGGGGSSLQFEKSSGLSPLADEKGFIVVYGQGTTWGKLEIPVWNGGACCGQAVDSQKNVDDVGYVRAIVTQIVTKYNIDKTRIYTTGMSNGGILSYRLACEASDIFAGAAIVSGGIQIKTCRPSKQIPVLLIHGTSDDRVPYSGGKGGGIVDATFLPVEIEFADWGARNGCTGEVKTVPVPPLVKDGKTIDKLAFPSCVKITELYRINGGTHEWPSGNPNADRPGKEDPSKALNASQTILNFFGL